MPQKERTVKQHEPVQAKPKKRKRVSPEIYADISRQIDALLPQSPFKLGINKEIFERLAGSCSVSKTLLRRAVNGHMMYVTSGKSYLKASMNASCRYGLDAGKTEMTEEHRKSAAVRLKRIRIKQSKSSDRAGESNGRP